MLPEAIQAGSCLPPRTVTPLGVEVSDFYRRMVGFRVSQDLGSKLTLPLNSCVTLGKSLNVSEPYPHNGVQRMHHRAEIIMKCLVHSKSSSFLSLGKSLQSSFAFHVHLFLQAFEVSSPSSGHTTSKQSRTQAFWLPAFPTYGA